MKKFFPLCVYASAFWFMQPVCVYAYETILTDQNVQGTLESARVNGILAQYLATIQMSDPEKATEMGLHGTDNKLTSRDTETRAAMLSTFKKFREQLHDIKRDMLYAPLRLDLDLFDHKLEVDIYNMENLDVLHRRPQYYLAMDAVYGVLNKEYAPKSVRAAAALARLEQLPKTLLQAEKNLSNPPRIWVEQAISQA
ncbi:MAG: DUF885 family protein, partial [bacterium]